jgi:ATP-dependent Clp protease ATP-binding subunit ClpC
VFRPLTKDDIYKIFDIEIGGVRKRLAEYDIEIEVPVEGKEWVLATKEVQNLEFGARPLRRGIEKYIENPLSEELLRGNLVGKSKVTVKVKKSKDKDKEGKETTELDFVYTDKPKDAKDKKKDKSETETVSADKK